MYPQTYEVAKTHQAALRQEVAADRLARPRGAAQRGRLWPPAALLSRGLRLVTQRQTVIAA